MAGMLRLGCGLVLALCAASAARADPLALQAELFQREQADARSDGFRAAGRVAGLGVMQFDYTRTQSNAPDRSHVAAIEWRPTGVTSGIALRAVERREGDVRTRGLELGWSKRF
jgi:hypothetical protein